MVDVAAPLAALGTTIAVPTLDGDADVDIPAGTQPGSVVVMAGKGMPSLRGGRRGDLRVFVDVVVPRRLSGGQRELLEQLAATLTEDNLRGDDTLVGKLRRLLRS